MVRFPSEFRVFERNVIQCFHTRSCSLYCLCWDLECDQGWNENSERAVLSCELSTKQWGDVNGHFHWGHCVKWGKIRLPLLNTWVRIHKSIKNLFHLYFAISSMSLGVNSQAFTCENCLEVYAKVINIAIKINKMSKTFLHHSFKLSLQMKCNHSAGD